MPVEGINLPLVEGDGTTALHLAASEGELIVVEGLLGMGADSSIPNDDGDTASHIAAWKGHVDVLQAFLPHAPRKNPIEMTTDDRGSGALFSLSQA